MSGEWWCGLCDTADTGGYPALARHYLNRHWNPTGPPVNVTKGIR